jgi:cytochrome c oxidase assembly protein subunit 15
VVQGGADGGAANNANFAAGIGPVAVWLFVLAAMVAAMVLLGGLTRLTGSGLSMVEWAPAALLPPLGGDAWAALFAKYQASPQFRLVNSDMDLTGFQHIFWLEYVHRLWGRLMGVVLLLPLAAFWVRGQIGPVLARRLLALFALGGLQGGLGWLMVASGLVDRPEVSPFRLAAHLLLGVALFGLLLWNALEVVRPGGRDARAPRTIIALLALLLLTMAWGALVAGFKAGLVDETFPLMDGQWLPANTLGWVQFTHRMLALSTVLALAGLWLRRRRLPQAARRPLALAAGWAWGQASLGIATLLSGVPVALAAAHQMGGLVLFSLVVWTLHAAQDG